MAYILKKITDTLFRYLLIMMVLATVGFVGWSIIKRNYLAQSDITIKDTPMVIEDVRPTGLLYLSSAITEDYTLDHFKGSGYGSSILGKGNGILKGDHQCIQILQQQVNYVMNLDSIKYKQPTDTTQQGSNNKLVIILPDVEYVPSTTSATFMSDNENEEGKVGYDATPLINRVEQQIRKRYDTPANRAVAREQAEKILTDIFASCGKEVIFK